MTLKKHSPSIVSYTELYESPLAKDGSLDKKQIKKAQYEFCKISIYLAKGDIAEIDEVRAIGK